MRSKKEILESIDRVVDRALEFEAVDKGTADFLSYIIKELDPDLHRAMVEENKKRYGK